jgi:hypothetical protein
LRCRSQKADGEHAARAGEVAHGQQARIGLDALTGAGKAHAEAGFVRAALRKRREHPFRVQVRQPVAVVSHVAQDAVAQRAEQLLPVAGSIQRRIDGLDRQRAALGGGHQVCRTLRVKDEGCHRKGREQLWSVHAGSHFRQRSGADRTLVSAQTLCHPRAGTFCASLSDRGIGPSVRLFEVGSDARSLRLDARLRTTSSPFATESGLLCQHALSTGVCNSATVLRIFDTSLGGWGESQSSRWAPDARKGI